MEESLDTGQPICRPPLQQCSASAVTITLTAVAHFLEGKGTLLCLLNRDIPHLSSLNQGVTRCVTKISQQSTIDDEQGGIREKEGLPCSSLAPATFFSLLLSRPLLGFDGAQTLLLSAQVPKSVPKLSRRRRRSSNSKYLFCEGTK